MSDKKRRKNKDRRSSAINRSVSDAEVVVANDAANVDRPEMPSREIATVQVPAKGAERQWFQFYKPTQGYWTRLCSGIGGAAFVIWGAQFLVNKLSVYRGAVWGMYVQVGVPVAWIVGLGYLLYWLLGRNRNCSDFMIAVEGEMKKVSWSTRVEIIGSTKVVILFVVLCALMLFVVDTLFMVIFSAIGVLRYAGVGDILRQLFGL